MFTKPDACPLPKNCSKLLQWYFVIAEPYLVSDAKRHPANRNPGIISMQVHAIAGICINHPHAAIFSQFSVCVLAGNGCVLDDKVT